MTFKRYLGYRIERSMLRTLVFTLLAVIVSQSIIRSEIRETAQNSETAIYMLAIVLGAACTLIPILELSDFLHRRNLDLLYAFPISRTKMALAHALSGWVQIVLIYSVSFIFAWTVYLGKSNWFSLGYLLPYYLLSLCVGFVLYSVFLFLFGEANSRLDGVIFCALGAFAPALIVTVLFEFMGWSAHEYFDPFSWFTVYSPLNNLTVVFQRLIESQRASDIVFRSDLLIRNANKVMEYSYLFALWGAIGIAALYGFFRRFSKKRAERVGDLSTSPFGYCVMLPIYGYYCLLASTSEGEVLLMIFSAIAFVSGYFVYRRSFRLFPSDIAVLLFGLVPVLLGMLY